MTSKEFKIEQYLTLPTIPAYLPADIHQNVILETRPRKHPYIHKKLKITEDMTKPHISSLGVIPIRSSAAIPNLRVVLEGMQATLDEEKQADPPKLYTSPATSFIIPELPSKNVGSDGKRKVRNKEQNKERMRNEPMGTEKRHEEAPMKKPAILSKVGTTVGVKFFERQKVVPKTSYLHCPRKQFKLVKPTSRPTSVDQSRSSVMSGDISDGSHDSIEHMGVSDDVETAVRFSERAQSQSSKDGSVTSVENLLEEAKRISSAGADPLFNQHTPKVKVTVYDRNKHKENKSLKSSKTLTSEKKSPREGKSKDPKAVEARFEEAVETKRGERTVDEIIASLRDQSAYNMETEADRKIRQIMDQIMSRTNAKFTLEDKEDEITYTRETDEKITAVEESEHQLSTVDIELAVTPVTSSDLLTEGEESLNVDSSDMTSLVPSVIAPAIEDISETKQAAVTVTSWTEELSEKFEVPEDQKQVIYIEDTEEHIAYLPDIQQAWEDLLAPPEASLEDIMNVHGEKIEIQESRTPALDNRTIVPSVTLLSTWSSSEGIKQTTAKTETTFTKNIHHFCCMTMDYQLPQSLMHVGRKYHTPDRFPSVMSNQPYRFKPGELTPLLESEDIPLSRSSARIEEAAARVVLESQKKMDLEEDSALSTLLEWQQKANSLIGELDLSLYGEAMQIKSDETQVYWSPAPPKLGAAPHKVKELLFPQYYLEELDEFGQLKSLVSANAESDSSDEEKGDTISHEDKTARGRTLLKRHNSAQDITTIGKEKSQVADGEQTPHSDPVRTSQSLLLRKRPQTATGTIGCEKVLAVPQDFSRTLIEIRQQKRLVDKAKKLMQVQQTSGAPVETEKEEVITIQSPQDKDVLTVTRETTKNAETVKDELTLAEKALQAGRKYVILPKTKKKKRNVRKMDIAKMEAVEKILMAKPLKKLQRHESMPQLNKIIERELRVPWKIRSYRPSVPDLLNFEEYKTRKRMSSGEDEREWVRAIWNKWFDLVFPPTPEDSDEDDTQSQDQEAEEKIEEATLNTDVVSAILSQDVIEIDPIPDTPENRNTYQSLLQEIEKLSKGTCKLTAFDLCRRGALYRKIGQLKKAEQDLDSAVQMELELLDAHWHRHLLYLLQDRKAAATEDLNFILTRNKHHSGAFRSMAEICKQQNDTTMAIINYSSAIKSNPLDHEAYFQRAQMYEQRGDMLLAMEDYAKAMRIMPSRTDIIMKHGIYYFENENWQYAINDFTKLLKVDPLSSTAHVYRGQAYVKVNNWVPAVQDFSAAIHLDPHNWQAFFMRACILRKAHPKRAIQDLSISLLLNDSEKNFLSFLHRGILYDSQGCSDDAIADFKSVLKLNNNLAVAHCNLGLIYMKRQSNFHRAIEKFTCAIDVDPTYLRAYVCRAEAFHKTHQVRKALKDFTRAIHMKPDVHHYYMYRGQLLLELGNLDLAAFCVRHASEVSIDNRASTFGGSPTQQAVVQSFLKNYDKALDVLNEAVQTKPIAPYFMLLGKTHMKAQQFQEAVTSFKQALDIMKPWNPTESWPPEAADANYLIGLCYMELTNCNEALQHFNLAIKLNPSCADAYYQRGLASVKLRQLKGILDFNKALALNPNMFQAYLSRACYYGMKGKYAKAILNCNEAIKIQPRCLRAYLYRGALKGHIKAYELAVLDLTKASSIDGQCPLPYFNRAVCYHEIGQFKKALTDYSIVLLLGDMLRLKVMINRGLLYFETHDYMNALSDFQAAAKMSPSDHKILHTLGLCLHKLNCLKEAVTVFTKCVQLKPFFYDGFIARGNTFMDFRNNRGLELAKRDYQRVLRLDPLCLPARINLAYAAQVSGKVMQAWKHFTSIIEVKPSCKSALEGRAIVNLQMSNTFGAFQDISQSINYGQTAELLTNRGVISQFTGDRVMAMADYQRAIKLDPSYSLAYFNAGNVYFHTRHFKQALDYYNKATMHNPRDESAFLNHAITKSNYAVTRYCNIGTIDWLTKHHLDDIHGAMIPISEQTSEQDMTSTSIRAAFIWVPERDLGAKGGQVLLHDTEGALADFETAASLSPHSAHIYFNRANLYASLQQYDLAEREYTRALKLKPDDALILKRRADARGKLGRQADAIKDYKRAVDIQERPHKLIKAESPKH